MFDYRMPENLKQTTSCRFNIFRDYPVFDGEKGEEPKRDSKYNDSRSVPEKGWTDRHQKTDQQKIENRKVGEAGWK